MGLGEPHSKSQVLTPLHGLQGRGLGYKEMEGTYSWPLMQQGLGLALQLFRRLPCLHARPQAQFPAESSYQGWKM